MQPAEASCKYSRQSQKMAARQGDKAFVYFFDSRFPKGWKRIG
jgi:hypothetical protein